MYVDMEKPLVAVVSNDHWTALKPEWSDREWHQHINAQKKREEKESKKVFCHAATYEEMMNMFPALKEKKMSDAVKKDDTCWVLRQDSETYLTHMDKWTQGGRPPSPLLKHPNVVALLVQLLVKDDQDVGWYHPAVIQVTAEYLKQNPPNMSQCRLLC